MGHVAEEDLQKFGGVPGVFSSFEVIGEVTEELHSLLKKSYKVTERVPRIEEDISFVPKDREQVIYIYMYRLAENPNLKNRKRLREAPVEVPGEGVFYHRPPVILDVFYLICVHSKFRSEAERLLGWTLLTMNNTTSLIKRSRRFILPDGRAVDSLGRDWDPEGKLEGDGLAVEKVSLALVDDLTVGDAINIFTMNEAPYRPFLTYRARLALDGPLLASSGTDISMGRLADPMEQPPRQATPDKSQPPISRPSGRIVGSPPPPKRVTPGPVAHNLRATQPNSQKEDK